MSTPPSSKTLTKTTPKPAASKPLVKALAPKPKAAVQGSTANEKVQQFTQILSAQFLEAVLPEALKTTNAEESPVAWAEHIKLINPFLPIQPAPIQAAHVAVVLTGIAERKKLKIALRPHQPETTAPASISVREIIPLGLVQNATNCLLVFRLKGHKAIHHLALSRIVSLELLGKFIYPKDFSLKDWINQTFLAKTGQNIRLIFRIERKVGEFLYDTPLAADQHIFTKKKKLEIHATVEDTPILDHWLQAFGKKISKIRKEPIV